MKSITRIFAICFFTFHLSQLTFQNVSAQQRDYAALVNPFIGTGGHGHTYPGAAMPFGAVQLSPDTRLDGWDGCSGYHYSDSVIYGFSHTHLSGTGCSDYGDILLMPVVTDKEFKLYDNKEYSSKFSHSNESASPGYYKVKLDKFNITAELTCTQRTGFHKYIFPKTKHATVLLDLKHRDEVIDSYVVIVNDSTVKGMRRSKAWATDQWVYFYMQFSKKFWQSGVSENDEFFKSNDAKGKNVKAFFDFDATDGKPIFVKVGISGVSEEGAMKNLFVENIKWDFEATKRAAHDAWNSELSKIDVEGATPNKQTIFYTALYHCMLNPNMYMDVDGSFRSTDNKVHNLTAEIKNGNAPLGYLDGGMSGTEAPISGFTNYTVFSLWDTYRALHPLLSIIDQKRTVDFVNTFMAQYHYGKILPVWELSGNETWCMIGYHSVPVITDAMMKGIYGFDNKLAFKAMRHSADTNLFGLSCYRKNGFLSNDCEHESVSKTLEYAYDDWCIAQVAKRLGNAGVYERFTQRAQSYKNVYDPSTGFMRGKNNGMFHSPFLPSEVNNYFTEANSWQYSFYVPQDLNGLMTLHGGLKNFQEKLKLLFTTDSKLEGRQQADITGLIGQYAHGNEPSHHIAYLFDYCAQPWMTQAFVHYICDSMYFNDPAGLSGNEDCGQMSAWFVMSAMGFYQVCPGSLQYALGTPYFDKVTLNLENGKKFVISAKGRSTEDFFVKSTSLNNAPYNKFYLNHLDIMNGGNFVFEMGGLLDVKTEIDLSALPVTEITEFPIVTAPFLHATSPVFRNKLTVALGNVDSTLKTFYIIGTKNNQVPVLYSKPFEIAESTRVSFYSQRNNIQSATLTTDFYKIPDNRMIDLKSEFDNQYTAGGKDALIDGIRGEADWRKGGWQGFAGKDVEAVIDLGKSMNIKKLGLSCLQETGPWIFFPSTIEFLVSDDNVAFRKAAEIKPDVANADSKLLAKSFVADVNEKCRYVKMIAKNFGTLPNWHISAGEKAWTFVDEIIIE